MRRLVSFFAALAIVGGSPCFAEGPENHNTHAAQQTAAQPSAHLVVDAALPGPLAKGAVILPFRLENMKLMPLYGAPALSVTPRVGHLHVTVDDASWHWVHADSEPIVVQGLAAGTHHVTLELADPVHHVIESKTVSFEIPQAQSSQ